MSILAVLLGVLAALALVELLLQVGAFVVWRSHRPEATSPSSGNRIVLCVGDSFTFGLGATSQDRAYPARLGARLLQSDPGSNWQVVGAGWPGRSSTQFMAALPGLLQSDHPSYVVLLIGLNDSWNRVTTDPTEPAPSSERPGWTWKWRTARLAAIVADRFRSRTASTPTKSAEPALPSAGQKPIETIDELEASLTDRTRRAEQNKAIWHLRQEAAAARDSALTMRVLRAATKVALVKVVLEDGQRLAQEKGPSAELLRLLVGPVMKLKDPKEALALARQAVQMDPGNAEGHRILAEMECSEGDVRVGARELLLAFHADHDSTKLAAKLRVFALPGDVDRATFDSLAADAIPDSIERAAAMRRYDASLESGAQEAALADRLEEAIRLIRDAGARPILLTYPNFGGKEPATVNACLRDVAARKRVPLVDLPPVFEARARDVPFTSLFVSDGHCADDGYDLMAQSVAQVLVGDAASF